MQYGRFNPHTDSTIGMAYCRYNKNPLVALDIWDSAGQERFFSIIPLYLRNVDVAIMVYDISKPDTFDRIQNRWYPFVIRSIDPDKLPIFVLVENKIDLASNPTITKKAQEWALYSGFMFFQVSPKQGIGINHMFEKICEKLLELPRNIHQETHQSSKIKLSNENKDNKWVDKFVNLFKCN